MGIAVEQVPEFPPPPLPSQRQRYSLVVSAIAGSLGEPAEQAFLALLSQTPFTGIALEQMGEFLPLWIPSQRHRYSFFSSWNSLLRMPASQPFLTRLSQRPSTGQGSGLQDWICVSRSDPEQLPPHASPTALLLVLLLLCVPPPQVASQAPHSLHCPQDPHPQLLGGFDPDALRLVAQSPVLQPALQVRVWVKDCPEQTVEALGDQAPPQEMAWDARGFAEEHVPEFEPPWAPSQRHR